MVADRGRRAETGLDLAGSWRGRPIQHIVARQGWPGGSPPGSRTTACGYPRHTLTVGPETGCKNLAVFVGGCNFQCHFCQDWIHQSMHESGKPAFSLEEILDWIDDDTTCVGFCGGEPLLYLPELILLCERMGQRFRDRIMRVCVETNLAVRSSLLERFAELVLDSGGGFNIGLKAGSDAIHRALTGQGSGQIWENLRRLHARFGARREVPLLRPSLLLVPGYVDAAEVEIVCRRVAAISTAIPMKFIPFFPRREMIDVRPTTHEELTRSIAIAGQFGFERVSPTLKEIDSHVRFVAEREVV